MKYEKQHQIRLKYRFHLIDKYGEMVFRYDNAPHLDIATFPHYKHLQSTIPNQKKKGLVQNDRPSSCLCVFVVSVS